MSMSILIIVMIFVVALFILGVFSPNKMRRGRWKADVIPPRIDWEAIQDPDIQQDIQADRKIAAIKKYRELTGCGLKEGKDAIEYVMAYGMTPKGGKTHRLMDRSDAGIRDLIAEGKIDEAIRIYQQFAGVDQFTAQDAVEQIQHEMHLSDPSGSGSVLKSGSDLFT